MDCGAQQATHHSTKCDVFKDVKLFPTVYRRICRKIATLSTQMSRYKSKCLRMYSYFHAVVCLRYVSFSRDAMDWVVIFLVFLVKFTCFLGAKTLKMQYCVLIVITE